MMLDFGIQEKEGYPDQDYEVVYLSQLKKGDRITGEIQVSNLKEDKYEGKIQHIFYVIITNHELELKWICNLKTAVYDNNGEITIYGKKGGRVYEFIDSLNHAMNQTPLNERKSYTVHYDTLQENINEKIGSVTVETVKSSYVNAKAPNLHVKSVELKEKKENNGSEDDELTPPAIKRLKECNPDLYDAINTISAGNHKITPSTIIEELKKMRQEGSLTNDLYKEAREDLQKMIQGN